MNVDMCMDIRTVIRTDVRIDICMPTCADMFYTDVYRDAYICTHVYSICIDTPADMCMGTSAAETCGSVFCRFPIIEGPVT